MSALDELRRKAEEKKAAEQQQELSEKQLEETYQTRLLPKMQRLYDTLNETISHLNFLEEPIVVENYCPRYPKFGTLAQKNYKINTDGRMGLANYNRLMQINLSFTCEAAGAFSYPLISTYLIDQEINFLQAKKLDFDWKHLTPKDGKAFANFTIKRKVPVSFRVEVLYELSKVKVTIQNHHNLDSYCKDFSPEQLDDNFLDIFLSYFLRKDTRLLQKMGEISAEHKTAIKTAVHNNFTRHQQEQALLVEKIKFKEAEDVPAIASETKPNFIRNIFSKFQK